MSKNGTNGRSPGTNGKGRYQDGKVRVAIIGVGNCASAFVQGIHHYRNACLLYTSPSPRDRS